MSLDKPHCSRLKKNTQKVEKDRTWSKPWEEEIDTRPRIKDGDTHLFGPFEKRGLTVGFEKKKEKEGSAGRERGLDPPERGNSPTEWSNEPAFTCCKIYAQGKKKTKK